MIALALLVALLVSGCCRHDVVAPVGIPLETAVMATVSWFVSSRGWKTRRPRGDSSAEDATFKETRHRVAFLFLRARHLLNAHTGWQDEPNQPTLRTRLAAELESVSHTIDSLVGTANHRGPLYGAPAPAPPAEPYLDIGVLATHVHGDGPDPVTIADAVAASAPDRRQGIVLAALDERRERAIADRVAGRGDRRRAVDGVRCDQHAVHDRVAGADRSPPLLRRAAPVSGQLGREARRYRRPVRRPQVGDAGLVRCHP